MIPDMIVYYNRVTYIMNRVGGKSKSPEIEDSKEILVYDGACGLCNSWSGFLSRLDKKNIFKLYTVQSGEGEAIITRLGLQGKPFDSMLLVRGGRVLAGSDALIAIIGRLPFPWYIFRVLRLVPKPLRERLYAYIARNRYRIFSRENCCELPAPPHSSRWQQRH